MKKEKEPNIIALIKFFEATNNEFLEMDHSIGPLTKKHLENVYNEYAKISAKENDKSTDNLKCAFEKLYDVIKLNGFNSPLYYSLKEYILHLDHLSKDKNYTPLSKPKFLTCMERIKIILSENKEVPKQ